MKCRRPDTPISEIVSRVNHWSVLEPPRNRVKVRIQDPIAIPKHHSTPQPDIVWAKPKSYGDHCPQPDEVFLVIEVADSSLDYDSGEKAELYAARGIKDDWVVDVPNQVIHVFRKPSKAGFAERISIKLSEEIRPLAFPDVALNLTGLYAKRNSARPAASEPFTRPLAATFASTT